MRNKKHKKRKLLIPAALGLMGKIGYSASDVIKSKLVYSVSLSHVTWSIMDALRDYIKTHDCAYMKGTNNIIGYRADITAKDAERFSTVLMYRKTPIFISMTPVKINSVRNDVNDTMLYMRTLNTKYNVDQLHEFIQMLVHKNDMIALSEFGNHHEYMQYNRSIALTQELRTFDTLFLPGTIEKDIKEHLNAFTSKRDWYFENGIPYHFGILLYGEAGTGKSSIAQAITKYLHANLIAMDGDLVGETLSEIRNSGMLSCYGDLYRNRFFVVLIEDIDCGQTVKSRDRYNTYMHAYDTEKKDEPKSGLATILNMFDGLTAPTNVVYVMTTNHIEQLDPALIRPGRIDLKIEVPGVTRETFDEFTSHYYENISGLPFEIKEGVTFADLQTKVMKGYTFDELIEYVKVK